MIRRLLLAALVAIPALGACASDYLPVTYDREAAGITTILVVDETFSGAPVVAKHRTTGGNIAAAAAPAGLVGAVVGATLSGAEKAVARGQEARLRTVLDYGGFDGEAVFDAALADALQARGYGTGVVDLPRRGRDNAIDMEADPDADPDTAVLDVNGFGYGYRFVGGDDLWRPFVRVDVRLTRRTDPGDVLMDQRLVYHASPETGFEVYSLPADETFAFDDIDAIEADPERARAGLAVALTDTAGAIADFLR